jgi:hypothetical protein
MKRHWGAIWLLATLLLANCGPMGSDRVVIDVRQVSGFDRVSLSSIGTMVITQGDREALEIEAQHYVTQRILTTVQNGTLNIGFGGTFFGEAIPTKGITYRLTVKQLSAVSFSGAGSIRSEGLSADRLEIRAAGVGTVYIENLEADELDVLLSGVGSVDVAGEVGDQEIILSSVGEYRAGDLRSQSASVRLSGVGRSTLWVEDSLRVRISGLGSVEYYGQPTVASDITGLGRLVELGAK